MSKIKLRVVFQGGGANLVTLMAAAAALEKLRDDDEIELVELIGVSAGAIVACMLASENRIGTYRGRIEDCGSRYLPHFELDIPKTEDDSNQKSNRRWFKKKSKQISLLSKIYSGEALFDEKKLNEFFHHLFVNQNNGKEKMGDLKIPTTVVAADLCYHKQLTYTSDQDREKSVVQALTDSCALPFAFRTHKTGLIADGGIANNFPIDQLIQENDDAFMLGFSFKAKPNFGSENVFQYAASLLATSIDSNVKENATRIVSLGGEICELERNYGIIEFKKALTEGIKLNRFETERDAILLDLTKTIARLRSKVTTEETADDIRNKVLEIYNSFDIHEPKIRETSSRVFAHSLRPDADESTLDKNNTIVKMRPSGDSIRVLSTGINAGSSPIVDSTTPWIIENDIGDTIDATQVIVRDRRHPSGGGREYRKALFFLKNPFLKKDGVLKLIEPKEGRFFVPLSENGIDYVRHQTLPPHTNSVVIQIIFIPKEFGKVILADLKSNLDLLKQLGEIPADSASSLRHWKSGRSMTKKEIQDHLGDHIHTSFDRYGWITEDVGPGKFCGYVVAKTGTDAANQLCILRNES